MPHAKATIAKRRKRRARHKAILEALKAGPLTVDEIVEVTGLWKVTVLSDLTNPHVGLIPLGFVHSTPDGKFQHA